MKSDTTKILDS